MTETFEIMLMGGHPNSLGRTVEVVDHVLAEPARLEELFVCYSSEDDVVRLRVSSAMKRVEVARHDLLLPYIDRFIDQIGQLDQPSAQWTLAILFEKLRPDMTASQESSSLALLKRNLAENDDWIVLNTTMDVLARWSKGNAALSGWFAPHLKRLAKDPRKSVSKKAAKLMSAAA
ncbi:hypothetical protein [Altererythrobacter sp. ZODW24]|uniref:hypothetical protein n=1 Tax=Altererythrobacter sp. ZODW24 TaxID=2185142 RepID=UPI000DF7891D|nr:hypothetical protein [Altererythrobacter sp. ZODW24]